MSDAGAPSLSFVVTALNEEKYIAAAAETVRRAAAGVAGDYEIILVDDGSTDATGRIMDGLAAGDPRLRVIHNARNLGLGGAYKRGVAAARMDYVMWVSGDNAETVEHLRQILGHVGEADIVIPVLVDQRSRPWFRRATSQFYVRLVNALFGLRIRYYNGAVVHRREIIQGVEIATDSFAYQTEALVRLLRAGRSYVEVPYTSASYSGVFSYALRPKNLWRVGATLVRLLRWTRCDGGRR